jgi:Bacterial archaeo-eukaryotic release factor family 10
MITYSEVEKLRSSRAPDESVLSLYLYVPPDVAELRDLPAHASRLITDATAETLGILRPEDEQAARRVVEAHARDWLGDTLGIFVSGKLGLLEVVPVPGRVPERAVLGVRPHVRPLLAAVQRHPDHRVVIIDHRHAWLLAVTADRVEVVARVPAEHPQSPGLGGWYLQPSHILERVTERAGHPYQDVAAILGRQTQAGGAQPLVIGGHADSIKQLVALLPREVREEYAGGFAADPHHLTLGKARALAAPVIAHWTLQRERQLVEAVTTTAAGVGMTIGLDNCLAAVNSDSVALLVVDDRAVMPGFHCERCDVLSVTSDGCSDWGAAARPVPDLLEEMTWRTLFSGGEVVSARTLPCAVAARLR